MKNFRVTLAAGISAAAMDSVSPVHSWQDPQNRRKTLPT